MAKEHLRLTVIAYVIFIFITTILTFAGTEHIHLLTESFVEMFSSSLPTIKSTAAESLGVGPIKRKGLHVIPESQKCSRWLSKTLAAAPTAMELKVSIVMSYFREESCILLQSLHSILYSVSRKFSYEIILVDDGNEVPSDSLLKLFDSLQVRYIRNTKRQGLVRSRMIGTRKSTGDVLIFMDSHVEVTENWIEPLLARLVEVRGQFESDLSWNNSYRGDRLIVSPVIDKMDPTDDSSYSFGSPAFKGGFNWTLLFDWEPRSGRTAKLKDLELSLEPFATPAIAGGIFAVWRDAFFELGGYDEEMDIWGAENVELSLRTWMCHGRLEIVPCSHVGHVFRNKHQYTFPEGKEFTVVRNLKRTALVWLLRDSGGTNKQNIDFLAQFYTALPSAAIVPAGDLRRRRQLAQQQNCHSFKWFLTNVFPELELRALPLKRNDRARQMAAFDVSAAKMEN